MKELAEVFPQFTKYRLENIARTETSSALTQGRLIRFTAPDSNTVAVQFVAIMDARTTPICQSRDGMIMRLDDPRLPANTPPLHYMCRSTLIPVDDWDWEDLTNGDERVLQRYFGYLKGPNAPRSLADALDGWKGAAPPLKGFGKVGEGAGPKPPKVGGGGPPRKPPKTPSVADGGEEPDDIDKAKKKSFYGIISPRPQEGAEEVAKRLLDERRIEVSRGDWDLSDAESKELLGNRISNLTSAIQSSLSNFPPSLLKELEKASDAGVRIRLVSGSTKTRVGSYDRRSRVLQFTVDTLSENTGVFEEEVVHLLDHWLGSKSKEILGVFSSGVALKLSLQGAAQELKALYEDKNILLGDYQDANSREFLAGMVRYYLADQEAFKLVYPELALWVQRYWFNEEFWRNAL